MSEWASTSTANKGVHIIVGHAVKGGMSISLESELRLTKLGVLYGDTVSLRSPKTEALKITYDVLRASGMDLDTDKIRSVVHASQYGVLDQYDVVWGQLKESLTMLADLKMKKSRAELRGSPDYLRMKRLLEKIPPRLKSMKTEILKNFRVSGYDQMEVLFQSGLADLKTDEASFNMNTVTESYIQYIFDLIGQNENSYPLLDETTSELVRLAIAEGKITASEGNKKRAGQVALSSEFIQRLPDFSFASSSEIIDIRSALSRSLVRFRSAMIEFNNSTSAAAWDAEFVSEAEILFRSKVEPSILEIEEAVSDNKIYKAFSRNLLTKAIESGFLTFGLTNISSLNSLIGKSNVEILGGVLGMTAGTMNDHLNERNKISKNQLYFIYKLSKML